MSESSVIVAAVQMRSDFGDVAGNLEKLRASVHRAANAGAKIVVAPECAIPGYADDDLRTIWYSPGRSVDPWFRLRDVAEVAEPIPGPTSSRLSAIAADCGVWMLAGLIERGDGGRAYNTALLMSPGGEVAAIHRKRWPWPAVEPAWATPGDTPVVHCRTPFGTVGIAICYDIHRVRRLYASGELWALLFPAAWIDDAPPAKYFDSRFPQVARHLKSHVVFANHSLPESTRWLGSGTSTIYRCNGTIASRSPLQFGDDVVIAELPAMG